MEISDLKQVLKQFTKYSDGDHHSYFSKPRKARWYFHKEEEFKIIVYADDSVYQLGTEADTIGVELKTFAAFKKRFESFTGIKFINKLNKND